MIANQGNLSFVKASSISPLTLIYRKIDDLLEPSPVTIEKFGISGAIYKKCFTIKAGYLTTI